ncbi:palmitoyl-acyl carrier protein [Salix suchowensis]|nr:palmitoyl-acyl carrier protein [Salix suchowensis]
MVDPFRQGFITEGDVGYRQTVVLRSYEVGGDKTATLESILNLLQETALNHAWVSGLLGDGFGATHDWLIRSDVTGEVLVRATSTWVMMNQQTGRLSTMLEVLRDEISPWFIENKAFEEENLKVICPGESDLDMNHHVSNVKYFNWMLEIIPRKFLENYQLTRMTLEYRREGNAAVQTHQDKNVDDVDSLASALFQDGDHRKSYTHLLQTTGDKESAEIVRGRTIWKRKL